MGLALLVSDVREAPHGAYECGSSERDWKALHERLVSFARRRARLEWEEGRLLWEAAQAGVHRRLGFAAFAEYVERLFGYNGRLVKEKLRVARALDALPATSDALRSGELSWSGARELTRVATAETERAWLDAARGLTIRQLEELVSGCAPGDLPTSTRSPRLRRYVLRFEVSGETRALMLEAFAKLRRDAGEGLDDDAALMLWARQVLASSASANANANANGGRASYQVQVNLCKACGRGEQLGNGETHALAPAIVEMSLCDAQVLGDSPGIGVVEAASREVGAGAVRAPVQRHADAPVGHATQTISPAMRRLVLRRDNGCCVVSGCKHALFVDLHHLVARANGGRHEADNLVCLCGAHHRALHQGRLIIEGKPSTGLAFKHADGTPYGGSVRAHAAERNAQVFAGLRELGFKERECRTAVERCATALAPDASREEMLRAALTELT